MITMTNWNCRGIGVSSTIRAMRDVLSLSKPQILFLAETKSTGSKIKSLKRKIHFANYHCVDAVGRSGGLALFWFDECVVEVLGSSKNYIHTKVTSPISSVSWFLTCVYGSPTFAERRNLWDSISRLKPRNDSPWCCIGDFNDLLSQDEKEGLLPHSQAQINLFREFVNNNMLLDLSLKGCRFTWCNNRAEGCVREKLDRILMNTQWMSLFPHAFGEALPAIGSDHSPIILHCDVKLIRSRRAFVYEDFWDEHPECAKTVENEWMSSNSPPQNGNIEGKLEKVKKGLISWSRKTFKRADKQINYIKNEINKLQNRRWDPSTLLRMSSLKKNLDDLWKQEEMFWKARSKIKWLNHGDRNSKFFHASTLQRRMFNKIGRIKDGNGVWVEKEEDVMKTFELFYQNLFSSEVSNNRPMYSDIIPHLVTDDMNRSLLSPITDAEVERAAFDMGPHKAPGPDGLNGLFFQKHWSVVKAEVIELVRNFFQDAVFPNGINTTHIALIPKVPSPEEVGQYRPISCCNYLYKIISKVLANRSKPCLPSLISDNQSAFVSKRLIQDNILVAQEVFHYLKHTKSRKDNSMALKLDMYKAYDCLEWDYILEILSSFGFSDKWVELIKKCISTVSYQIKFNGKLSSPFSPMRGLRQGDPISPYLFILAAEGLSRLISKATDEGRLSGIKIGRDSPCLTHLFFADDAMILCKASRSNCFELVRILNCYTSASARR